MYTLLIVFYVLVSVALIALVLFQQGKGADAGAAFGSGSSGTVFGARGSANFLTRATAWLATIFFVLSLALAYVVHGRSTSRSIIDAEPKSQPEAAAPVTAPVVPPASGDNAAPAAAGPAPANAPSAPPSSDDKATKLKPAVTPDQTPKVPQ